MPEMPVFLLKNAKQIQKAAMIHWALARGFNDTCPLSLRSPQLQRDTPRAGTSHLKSSSTAWGKVWKLLFLLIWLLSLMATFPNIWVEKLLGKKE